MAGSSEHLEVVLGQVERCVTEQDWDALAELDEQARQSVLEAREQAEKGQLDPAGVATQIERLKALYDQAGEQARAFRDETARTIRESSRNQQAAQAYRKNQ